MKITGGKTVYGATVGILMLESRFPRIPGDGGHAGTWPFPMQFRVVPGATPDRVVRRQAEGLLDRFIEAGKSLISGGVDGITTNCGFLGLYQADLATALGVPVAASSLMQVPLVQALLPPGKRVGIITISAETLSSEHLAVVGIDPTTPIVGTDRGREFSRVILGDETELDVHQARADVVAAAEALVAAYPDVGALVLECTNMSPYSAAVAATVERPVYDFVSFVSWFQAGLSPRRFPPPT